MSKLQEQAKEQGLRTEIDDSNESVGKKIREAEIMKVPYTVVIGEKELSSGKLIPRIRKDLEVQERKAGLGSSEFLKSVANEAKSRASKSSTCGFAS